MDQVSDRRDWQCVVKAYFFHVRQRWDGKKIFLSPFFEAEYFLTWLGFFGHFHHDHLFF